MAARFFETVFRLTAVFTGAAAFNHMADSMKNIDKGIQGAEKSAKAGVTSFQKLAGAAIGVAAGIVSIQKIGQYLKDAKAEAMAGQKAFDNLGLALSRVGALQKLEIIAPGTIEDQQKKLYNLAATMEETAGIAKTTLSAAFASASRSFSPEMIKQGSDGLQDFIVKTRGLRATADDAAEVMGKVTFAIENQSTKGLMQAKILNKQQEDQYKAMIKAGAGHAARSKFFYDIITKTTGETARQFATLDGKIYSNQLAWGRVSEAVGKVQLSIEGGLAPVFEKLANKLEPVISKLSDKLIKWFADMEPHLAKLDPLFEKFGDALMSTFGWLEDNWDIVEVALVGIAAAVVGLTAALVAFVAVSLAPWLGIVAAVGLVSFAIGLLVVHWDKIAPAAEAAWSAIMMIWEPIGQWFFDHVVKPITRAWNDLLAAFRGEISWGEAFGSIGEEILTIFQNIGKGIVAALGAGIEAAGKIDWFKLLGDAANLGAQFNAWVLKAIGDAWKAIPWGDALGNAGTFISAIVKFIGDSIGSAWGMIQWPKVDWGAIFGGVSMPDIKLPDFSALKFPPAPEWLTKLFTFKLPGWMGGDKTPPPAAEIVAIPDASIVAALEEALRRVREIVKEVSTTFQSWQLPPSLLSGMDQLVTKAGDVKRAISEAGANASAISVPGLQVGGLVAHPTIAALAERGTPEMVIPLQPTERSRGLLSQAASAIGVRRQGGGQQGPVNVTVSPVINIGSIAQGQEQAVGREIERAMENPVRQLLEELQKAKSEEQR